MSLIQTISIRRAIIVLAVLAAGCGRTNQVPNAEPQEVELNQINVMYRMYMKLHDKQPPEKLSDLKEKRSLHSRAFQLVQEGKYVVVWGVKDRDPETVMAYEKDAPTNGGWTLMADGKVKRLDAAAFQNVPKPQK